MEEQAVRELPVRELVAAAVEKRAPVARAGSVVLEPRMRFGRRPPIAPRPDLVVEVAVVVAFSVPATPATVVRVGYMAAAAVVAAGPMS
jgi:hypothetical protein